MSENNLSLPLLLQRSDRRLLRTLLLDGVTFAGVVSRFGDGPGPILDPTGYCPALSCCWLRSIVFQSAVFFFLRADCVSCYIVRSTYFTPPMFVITALEAWRAFLIPSYSVSAS